MEFIYNFFLNCPGVTPVFFLNARIKLPLSLNPAIGATSTTLSPCSRSSLA